MTLHPTMDWCDWHQERLIYSGKNAEGRRPTIYRPEALVTFDQRTSLEFEVRPVNGLSALTLRGTCKRQLGGNFMPSDMVIPVGWPAFERATPHGAMDSWEYVVRWRLVTPLIDRQDPEVVRVRSVLTPAMEIVTEEDDPIRELLTRSFVFEGRTFATREDAESAQRRSRLAAMILLVLIHAGVTGPTGTDLADIIACVMRSRKEEFIELLG